MIGFSLRTLSLKPVAHWEPQRVKQLQERRLRGLLKWAARSSPFYRELYEGHDLSRCNLSDLPTTTKSQLMARLDDVVTDREIRRAALERFVDDPANEGRWYLGRYAVSHTSGSQGQPLLMVCDRQHLELLFAMQMSRGNVGKVTPLEALRKFFFPARLAVVTLKSGFYPSASSFEYMPAAARRYVSVLRLSQTDTDLVERLDAFRPTALTGYASVLEMLAIEADAGRLSLAPELEQVVNNSEVLTDKARERIERAFGLHVMNNYATGECPFLTNGCPTDEGAHVNSDWAIIEVADENNRPVPAGQPGKKVLITNLANRVQPFIRYEVGDIVTMATEPCRCGSRLPRIERIEGRSADTFWVRDGAGYRQLINSVFKNAFDYTREVREWQAVQTQRNTVAVKLELLPGAELDREHAWWSLNRQLEMYRFRGVVDVSLEVVPRLAAEGKSGKFKRMVSLVGPPEAAVEQLEQSRLRFDAREPLPLAIHDRQTGEAARDEFQPMGRRQGRKRRDR
jgi:phenylacetate-coenzyme A ligase PaaK-like adenylate-forming protein